MKRTKKCILLLTALMMVCIISVIPVMANDIIVKIDGQQIAFDVPPRLINDRTMVPLRAIFEALGASVNWNNDTETVTSTKDQTTIQLTINSPTMYVNGSAVTLDSPACLVDDRTLVPVRAISEAFGTTVNWIENENTVSIITKEIPIEEITFNNANDTISVGESKKLSVNIYPPYATDNTLIWTSSNTSIVTVNDGTITGIAAGTANITCKTNDGIISECKITVTPAPIKATAVGIDIDGQYIAPYSTIELSVGDTIQLNAKVLPENANTNTDVTWIFTGSSEYLTLSPNGELKGNGVSSGCQIRAMLPDGTTTIFGVNIKKPTVKIELRSVLPNILNDYNYSGRLSSSCKITKFEYEVSDYKSEEQTVTLYFSGEKLFDGDDDMNTRTSSSCKISWKLYDEDGYVVDSDTCYSSSIAKGEKFKKAKSLIFDVLPGKYYLELLDTK